MPLNLGGNQGMEKFTSTVPVRRIQSIRADRQTGIPFFTMSAAVVGFNAGI
jgi:hypothetical protein